MKKTKINDIYAKGGWIRDDGSMIHDMYLMQVKSPDKSTEPWDYYNIAQTFKGEAAWTTKAESQVRDSGSKTRRRRRGRAERATMQVFLSQLTLGLVNGSFYAMLSLGLAVIFGLLGIVNFAHGALYMLGAYVAFIGMDKLGINYWAALIVAPIVIGALGVAIERLFLRHLYKIDPIYGLLLTFGLALIAEGVLRYFFGVSGQSYDKPELLAGSIDLGFMVLPIYRAWVVVASLTICLGTWFLIERTSLGATLRAGTENPALVQAFGINVPLMVTLTYAGGAGAGRDRRRARRADHPGHAADGLEPDHRRLRRRRHRRHGVDPRLDPHRPRRSAWSRA